MDMTVKPGDRITVRVDHVEYLTVMDDNLVQRFQQDPDHPILSSVPMITVNSLGGFVQMRDMNELARRYHQGAFTQREYAEAVMACGYSVSGWCDYSEFDSMLIENPLWADEDDNEWSNYTNSYLISKLKKHDFNLQHVIEIIQLRDSISKEEAERQFVDECVLE
jgi:hypothetical protein